MSRQSVLAFSALSACAILVQAPTVWAQVAPPPPSPATEAPRAGVQAIFFSPSGEVFRAPIKDPYPTVLWFAQADIDKDAALSREEFMTDAVRYFAIVDRDGKGIITSQDNSHYEAELSPEITGFSPLVAQPKAPPSNDGDASSPQGKQGYIKRVQGAAQFSLINEPQPIRGADANFDFRITTEEWTRASEQRFSMLDKDKDGRLTIEELPKTPLQKGLEIRAAEREKAKSKGGGLFGGKRD